MNNFELDARLEADCIVVKDFDLCRLLLMNNSHYPWCILVPMRANMTEIYQLSEEDQIQLVRESSRLAKAMLELFPGIKLNVAALGNMVPQLHIHHIVRREIDKAWPAPVWGHEPPEPYDEKEIKLLCAKLEMI